MARLNSPRKASRYRKGGLSMNNPVRLHSPNAHPPVHRENSPSQKKAIPDFYKFPYRFLMFYFKKNSYRELLPTEPL